MASSDGKSGTLAPGHLHLYSIPKGEVTRSIPLQSQDEVITEISTNGAWIAVGTTSQRIYLIEIESLQIRTVIQCWKDPEAGHGPTYALGPRWLAFQSGAPLNGELDASVAKKAKKVVDEEASKETKEAKKNVQTPPQNWTQKEVVALGYAAVREGMYLGSQLFTSMVNSYYNGEAAPVMSSAPGTIEIWNLPPLRSPDNGRIACIALFSADTRRIERMAFDEPGLILSTAADGGQSVKIWNVAHIISSISPNMTFTPMYVLERGTTLGTISSLSFTDDSSLVAFTTKPKGTVHVFPCALSGQPVGLSTHLPGSIPDTWHIGEPAADALKPHKLAAIHSPANSNANFSGVIRLSNYPLTASRSDQKRAAHAHDRTLYAFYPNGSLMRQDFAFKSDQAVPSPSLAMVVTPRYKWELCRTTSGSAQFPFYSPIDHNHDGLLGAAAHISASMASHASGIANSGAAGDANASPASAPDASALLANVETQTHSFASGPDFGAALGANHVSAHASPSDSSSSHLPKFAIFAYTDLPQPQRDINSAWRDDSVFAALKPVKLHSPGLPGGTSANASNKPSPNALGIPHQHFNNANNAAGLHHHAAGGLLPVPIAAPSSPAPKPSVVAPIASPSSSFDVPPSSIPQSSAPKTATAAPIPSSPYSHEASSSAPSSAPKKTAVAPIPSSPHAHEASSSEPPHAKPQAKPSAAKEEQKREEKKEEPKVVVAPKEAPKVAPADNKEQRPAKEAQEIKEPKEPEKEEEKEAPPKSNRKNSAPSQAAPIAVNNAFGLLMAEGGGNDSQPDDDDEYAANLPIVAPKKESPPASASSSLPVPIASAPQPAPAKGKKKKGKAAAAAPSNNNNNHHNNDDGLSVSPHSDGIPAPSTSPAKWSDIAKKGGS